MPDKELIEMIGVWLHPYLGLDMKRHKGLLDWLSQGFIEWLERKGYEVVRKERSSNAR